jgi:DNA-directed RNA polymerase subunit RPC12/RpoP
MVNTARLSLKNTDRCPHCGSNFIAMDQMEKEPYCFYCGWRNTIRITAEQAKARTKWYSWVSFLKEIE